jgi:hypothetical protein
VEEGASEEVEEVDVGFAFDVEVRRRLDGDLLEVALVVLGRTRVDVLVVGWTFLVVVCFGGLPSPTKLHEP